MMESPLLTVQQFVIKHPAFRMGGVNKWIFKRRENGLHKAILQIGRKTLIDEKLFLEWIYEQQYKAA